MIEPDREFGDLVAGATYVLRPGGYAVIFDASGDVAVVSTSQGLFLPGGGQEDDETPDQAAVREAFEECGLSIRLGERLGTADELAFAEEEDAYYRKRCVFFHGEVVKRENSSEKDHELVWVPPLGSHHETTARESALDSLPGDPLGVRLLVKAHQRGIRAC